MVKPPGVAFVFNKLRTVDWGFLERTKILSPEILFRAVFFGRFEAKDTGIPQADKICFDAFFCFEQMHHLSRKNTEVLETARQVSLLVSSECRSVCFLSETSTFRFSHQGDSTTPCNTLTHRQGFQCKAQRSTHLLTHPSSFLKQNKPHA